MGKRLVAYFSSSEKRTFRNTFLKDYDLSGKKIAVFATSGGSGIGKTADKLKPYISDTTEIVTAECMSGSESREALNAWADRCDENK